MGNNSQNDRNRNYKIIGSEDLTVVTPGTAVNPSSNVEAVFVRIRNNNSGLVACGMADADVDATSSPIKGEVLSQYEFHTFAVDANASEVFVDAVGAGTVVQVELWGRD